ncbi:DUF1307 domain-containing protein [Oceanobacillus sp. J11TS1]|uniref:DUF1307 domain-containing protein n=1 Tax=Oceanobacillus sp. J11TS1 TaxID=2807191 RepID=UPI001B1D5853|nr:DUF1307 domain-containing protein [Oceanobacillus sp. J11TS1]GIO23565.1 hypothetical protein J11TS1_21460 [Oceanobacillus sp. J11TS1]
MKKKTFRITGLLFLLIAIVGLTACGKEKTVVLQAEDFGINAEVTIEAKGDEMTKQTAKQELPYDLLDIGSKEEAESLDDMLLADLESYKDIEGYEYGIEYGEDSLTLTESFDFVAGDIKELNTIPEADFPELEDNEYLSLEETIKLFEDDGFEVVEEKEE